MAGYLQRFADENPDFVSLVDPAGREWSRRELNGEVNRLTRAFSTAGLVEGDALALIAPNCAEYLVAYLAAVQAGLRVVPVNWHLADSEIAFVLENSAARAVVTHEQLGAPMLQKIAAHCAPEARRIVIGDAPEYVPLRHFVAGHSADPVLDAPASGWVMAYTSATTGRPKAVQFPPRDLAADMELIISGSRRLGIFVEDNNVHLCSSMLYHPAPLGGCEVALYMGHRVVLVERWEPKLLLELIDRHRVTTTFMVPTMFVRLLKLPKSERERYSTASLRLVVHGGAPCPPAVKRQMIEWWGGVIWEAYAATEVQGTVVSAAEWLAHPGTVGRPLQGGRVKILDENGSELPPGEVGLVYLPAQSRHRFQYKGDPDKTSRSYRGDFITVGDLGYLDEEGRLYLCDRATETIISSGMNIYPAEIETVLIEHPLVADCAVLREPHELLGEVPKAFVELEPGAQAGSALTAELLRYLSARLSPMKLPKRFEYVASLPRDPNGKLFKRLLRGTAAPAVIQPQEDLALRDRRSAGETA